MLPNKPNQNIMTKKKEITKSAAPQKAAPVKVDVKMQGNTTLDPVVGAFPDEIPPDTEEFKLTKNIEAILKKKEMSKSEKMRALYRIQVTSVKEIAYWLNNTHPSFISSVLLKLKRQIKKEAGK